MNETRVIESLAVPRGRFPHVKTAGDFVYISGTSARRPDNTIEGADADEFGTTRLDIRAQTRAVLGNIQRILSAFDADLPDLVQVTTYLVSMNDFGGYNEVYAEFLNEAGPTRTTVAVHQLPHPHLLLEMQAVAHIVGLSQRMPTNARDRSAPGSVTGPDNPRAPHASTRKAAP